MLRGVYFELEFSRRSITELARTCLITNYPPANPLLPPTGRVYPTSDDGTQWVSVTPPLPKRHRRIGTALN